MTKRITDLMDGYHDTIIPLPEASFPTPERTKELTMKKIKKQQNTVKNRRRIPRGLLIAACLTLVLTITAGAVGYTLWDSARNDLGISSDADLPEYTEYSAETQVSSPPSSEALSQTEELVDGASIELISTLCSGSEVTAYVGISPVTQEMADACWDEAQELYTFAYWDLGMFDAQGADLTEGFSAGSTQVEYNAETQTALVRLDLNGPVFHEATAFTAGIYWYQENGGTPEVRHYGTVTIPITQSEALYATPEAELENWFLSEATGTLSQVELRAGYISFTLEVTPFDALCQALGEDAYFIIGDAYWNYYNALNDMELDTEFTDLDASVAYKRSWSVTLSQLLENATLQMADGSSIVIAEQDSLYACLLQESEDLEAGTFTFSFDQLTPIDLSQVERITIGGTTCPMLP